MSDDEEEYQYDDDDYNYGSDAEDNEGDQGDDKLIQIENAFYEGEESLGEGNLAVAKSKFELVCQLSDDSDTIKWKFKGLQHLVILCYNLNDYTELVVKYREMMSYISSVTRNECTDAINNILDVVQGARSLNVLSEIYEITLVALKSTNNERLWFSTNLKLAKVYIEEKKISEVEQILSTLKKTCLNPDGTDDLTKSNSLLEVYCLEIHLCSVTLDSLRMRDIYPKTLNISSAIVDLRTLGVIREEGGKLYMAEGNWNDAYNELYQAFRHYQEAGNSRAKDCLKYVIMASMLVEDNDINPFAAREVKVYENDKEIVAMSELRKSLEANDLSKFERTIRNKQNKIGEEPFLMTYIQPLRRRMREQAILNLVKPFKKVTFEYLSKELTLTTDEVEHIIITLILDEKVNAVIDQVSNVIIFHNENDSNLQKIIELEKMTRNVKHHFKFSEYM